jgi:hypothetical protein
VLAGARRYLPGTPSARVGTACAPPQRQAVVDVARHFIGGSLVAGTLTTELADCDLTNGEALYGTLEPLRARCGTTHQLTVLSQSAPWTSVRQDAWASTVPR